MLNKQNISIVFVIGLTLTNGITVPASAHEGGTGAGNGGHAVVCKNGREEIRSVEFFDHFEAEKIYGKKVDLGASSLSVERKVKLAADRIREYFPNFASDLEKFEQTFLDRSYFVQKDLPEVPDSGDIIYPKGCKEVQAIIRAKLAPGEDKVFTINQILWDRMDNDNQATAIIHEFIYARAIDYYAHENSVNSRRLNAEILSTPAITSDTLPSWIRLFNLLNLGFAEPMGCLNYKTPNCNSAIFFDGDTLYGTTQAPLTVRSTRLGNIRLARGNFKIRTKSDTGNVLVSGTFLDPQTFETTDGPIPFEGRFEETNHRLVLDGTTTLPTLKSGGQEVTVPVGCKWDVRLQINESKMLFVDRAKIINTECVTSFSFPKEGISVAGSKITFLAIGDNTERGDPDARTEYRAQYFDFTLESGTLTWPYGTSVIKVKTQIEGKGSNYGGYHSYGLQAKSTQEIGRTSLRYGPDLFNDVPFSAINIGGSQTKDIILSATIAGQFPVTIRPRSGIELSGTLSKYVFETELGYGAGSSNLIGNFKLSRLDGFAKSFLGLPVGELSFYTTKYENPQSIESLNFILGELPEPTGNAIKWISRAEISGEKTPLRKAIRSNDCQRTMEFELSGPLELAPKKRCGGDSDRFNLERGAVLISSTSGLIKFGRNTLPAYESDQRGNHSRATYFEEGRLSKRGLELDQLIFKKY